MPLPGHRSRALQWTLSGHCSDTAVPWTEHVHEQLGKCLDYDNREIGNKFGVGASTACEKVNLAGTNENLFRLVVAGTVPKFVLEEPTEGAGSKDLKTRPKIRDPGNIDC